MQCQQLIRAGRTLYN